MLHLRRSGTFAHVTTRSYDHVTTRSYDHKRSTGPVSKETVTEQMRAISEMTTEINWRNGPQWQHLEIAPPPPLSLAICSHHSSQIPNPKSRQSRLLRRPMQPISHTHHRQLSHMHHRQLPSTPPFLPRFVLLHRSAHVECKLSGRCGGQCAGALRGEELQQTRRNAAR